MNHYVRFTYWIKRIINLSLAESGLDPESISKIILNFLSKENTSREDKEEFSRFLEERKIKHLVHFTRVDNVKNILRFGLIPRKFLEEEAIKIALNPVFADSQRLDGREEVNCLSVSFPNYQMFYKKSKDNRDEWAVILFDLNIIKKHRCKFTSTNLASKDSKPIGGIEGAEQMFFDLDLRERLGLPSHHTTNPQAETLEYSVVPHLWIKEVHLSSNKYLSKVTKWKQSENTIVKVDRKYFRPRDDYSHWSTGSQRSQ